VPTTPPPTRRSKGASPRARGSYPNCDYLPTLASGIWGSLADASGPATGDGRKSPAAVLVDW
jgi:hypothetical protein